MKRAITTITALLFAAIAFAQGEQHEEWLAPFNAIEVNGAMKVNIIEQKEELPQKISYSLNGGREDYFKVDVRKDKTLCITERADKERQGTTEVTIYTQSFDSIKAALADVWFKDIFTSLLFDITLNQKARLTGEFNLQDLKVELNGKSTAQLTGTARYLTLDASTSNVAAAELSTVSARVKASQKADVDITATDRVEIECSSSARVYYGGDPNIVRTFNAFIGGKITPRK